MTIDGSVLTRIRTSYLLGGLLNRSVLEKACDLYEILQLGKSLRRHLQCCI